MTSRDKNPSLRGGSTLRWSVGQWGIFVLFGGVFVIASTQGSEASDVSAKVIGVAMALWALALLWPTRLEVHEDGVTVRSFLRRRFIPYADLKRARGVQKLLSCPENSSQWSLLEGFELELHDGKTITLPCGRKTAEVTQGSTGDLGVFCPLEREHVLLAREINTRIDEARHVRLPRAALAKSLARGDKTFEAWLAALEAFAKPVAGGGYRDAPDDTEALFRVLEDRASPRDARAAAAAVLRERIDDAGRLRMGVALEDDASPKLRVLVDTALDDDAEPGAVRAALERASVRGPGD